MRTRGRFVEHRWPVHAVVDLSAPEPARFLAQLADQQLRYGHPSTRRGSAVWTRLAARGLPTNLLARMFHAGLPTAAADIRALRALLADQWSQLADRSPLLDPAAGDRLSLLAVRRRSAMTVLAFAGGSSPVVVAKYPRADAAPLIAEDDALAAAAASGVAPRPLGVVDGWHIQEGRPGQPVPLPPLDAAAAARLTWTPDFAALGSGLVALAAVTAHDEPPDDVLPWLDTAALSLGDARTRAAVEAAARDVARLPRSVLGHGDLAGQNWLVDAGTLGGIVDWEDARRHAPAGFDVLHAAFTWVEQAVGLKHWAPASVVTSFAAAWDSPFGSAARTTARDAMTAAGVLPELHDAVAVAYFARRVGRRLVAPTAYRLPADAATDMLRVVCQ